MVPAMAVLVTGATGFIGRRLVANLVQEGQDVRALLLPDEPVDRLAPAQVWRGDVTRGESLREAVRGVSCVYHLAAMVGDWGPEREFQRINVDGTRNLLEAACAAGSPRVVVVSSVIVYGWQLHTAVCDEDRPYGRATGPYSRTKAAAERLALDYHRQGRVPVTVVRPGNVYGPGSRLWLEEVLAVVRAGRAVLIGDGEGDAALAYVDNVALAIARAGQNARASGRVYNVNDGGGISWRRYLSDLATLAGAPPPRHRLAPRAAMALAGGFEIVQRLRPGGSRPLLTRDAVTLLGSRAPVPIARANSELDYRPPVSYEQAMERVAAYVHGGAIA
jgi:nucleoside-diphosphate-sugar epimerase